MRLPRVRFTVRQLMVLAAVVALSLWAGRQIEWAMPAPRWAPIIGPDGKVIGKRMKGKAIKQAETKVLPGSEPTPR